MTRKVFVACSSYERNYVLMNACDKVAFRSVVSICNVEAYDDATNTAAESFLTWDILEDLMPFLTQPAIDVDIRGTKSDLERKVQELGLQTKQTVILINSSQLKLISPDSAVLVYPYWISSLLDPTRVVVDFSLSNVQEVGNYFLYRCSPLKEVDLSGLSNVQKVGDMFLCGCSSLKEVDLSPLSNVQKVGHRFLCGCPSLKEVDLSPLSNVQKVGHSFLYGCSSLKEVDLSPLSNVHEVGHHFLDGCSSLTRVILPASPPECLRLAVPPHLLPTQRSCAVS